MDGPGLLITCCLRVDVPVLKTYQQLFLYFVPLVCNTVSINIIVVVVRLIWFRRYLKKAGQSIIIFLINERLMTLVQSSCLGEPTQAYGSGSQRGP